MLRAGGVLEEAVDYPLLGNRIVQSRLVAACEGGRSHHCYLFEGPAGVGKFTFALWLARYLNCESRGARPCGACPVCSQMLAGSHPDLIVVGPDPDRATRVISIDQAHALTRALALQRFSAERRFVVIDPADAFNEESANALLKTLEEPPAGTQFILVTDRAASLLPTIRSRSQRVRFGPVPRADLEAWLLSRGMDPGLAVDADGSPGRAVRLAEGEAEARRQLRESILELVGQPLHRLFAFTEAEGKKEEGSSRAAVAIDVLEELLRDATMVGSGREAAVLHPELLPQYQHWASLLWPGGIARMSVHLGEARQRLALNVNGRTVLDALLAQLNLEAR